MAHDAAIFLSGRLVLFNQQAHDAKPATVRDRSDHRAGMASCPKHQYRLPFRRIHHQNPS
jgi:hypothetical protein